MGKKNNKCLSISHKFSFITIVLIAFFEFIFILMMFSEKVRNLFRLVFLDSGGRFNWIAVTSLVAIVSLLMNSIFTAKQYKADLISKARISWLNSAREISTEIIFNAYRIASLLNTISSNKLFLDSLNAEKTPTSQSSSYKLQQQIVSENDDLIKSVNHHRAKLIEQTTLFKMYLGPNTDNDQLVAKSEALMKFSEDLIILHMSSETKCLSLKIDIGPLGKYGENLMDKFTDSSRIYYKTEWEKVKEGK